MEEAGVVAGGGELTAGGGAGAASGEDASGAGAGAGAAAGDSVADMMEDVTEIYFLRRQQPDQDEKRVKGCNKINNSLVQSSLRC